MSDSPVIHIHGRTVSLDVTETGRFGVTKAELKDIIIKILCNTKSGSRKQRALFNMVLKYMKIKIYGQPKEELLKVYIEVLREMKDESMVGFKSGKTATYIYI